METEIKREQLKAPDLDAVPPSKRILSRLPFSGPALVTLVLMMVIWQGFVVAFNPPPWLVPAPADVALALYNGFAADPQSTGAYYVHIATTLQESLSGWVIGSVLGILLGIGMSQIRLIERALLPYVNMSQTIPKIAIAPLFLVWFGIGIESKIGLVITSAFFPTFLNSLVAFKSAEQDLLDMMRALGATKWEIVRQILLPSAIPMIFAGLELALLHSFLGAVAGEFVGARTGVGVLLLNRSHNLDTGGIFAILAILAVLGWLLDSVLMLIRRKLLFWSPIERGQVTI